MNTGSLDQLARKFKTDKSSDTHCFADFYEPYVSHFKNKSVTLLEVGIGKKEMPSLNMWSEYFPDGKIFGVDINTYEPCRNIYTFVVDQSHESQLSDFMKEYGPFDIIIDDGSHYCSHQLRTLENAFNHLTDDGIIIIEDLHSSLPSHCKGINIDTPISALDTVKDLSSKMYVDIYRGDTRNHAGSTSITSVIIPSRSPKCQK